MFSNNDGKIVGAKEKIARAQMIKQGGGYGAVQSKREGRQPSPLIPVTIVFGIAAVFATILTQGPLQSGVNINTGSSALDKILFGPGIYNFTGLPETDMAIVIFLRALAMFIVAGIIPFVTHTWQRMLDRAHMNVYVTFWGVSIALGLIYYLIKDSLVPLLAEVFDILFG